MTMQPFCPAVVELGKSETYLRTFPASMAARRSFSLTSASRAALTMMTPRFIIAIASALIMPLVSGSAGTWIVMKSHAR